MYISEIDDILDQTIDKFVYTWIIESKVPDLIAFTALIKEVNFMKYQKQINKILEFAIELISQNDINKIVSKNSNILLINNLVSKYLGYYLFILIGINYNGKIEMFNNNLIEFSRNQSNYNVKINNFFNSESNSTIIKTINLINELTDYLNKLKLKKGDIKKLINLYSPNLNEFVELYGEENINNLVDLLDNKEVVKNKIIFFVEVISEIFLTEWL